MDRILIFDQDRPQIDLYTRTVTQGEEYELVKQFIDYYCLQFMRNNKKTNLAVFVEPRLSSGFPDIVFASYLPSIERTWSSARKLLGTNDLKVLSHLILKGGVGGGHLQSTLKLPEGQTLLSLERLMDAKLVSYRNKKWTARELRDVFSIDKLVSVEAKINNISKAMEQSLINTWFASHSYALTNVSNPQPGTLKAFSRQGLGLYCKRKSFQRVIKAPELSLPSSYLSLKFNEWIGNSLTQ